LKVPKGIKGTDPFVTVLDPATGTGTFLYECIELIEQTMKERWCRELNRSDWHDADVLTRWVKYVSTHLLPRLCGFELMMASYAVAHLKLSFKLGETGYHLAVGDRIRVLLTNSLEAPSDTGQQQLAGAFPALAQESKAVNGVKREHRFTVVIGNPPYSAASHNPSIDANGDLTHIGSLMRRYYEIDGVSLGEKNPRWLQDDYVKFLRLAQAEVEQTGVGVIGMITNHGYLANPTFRGMRYSLLNTFDQVAVVDLHGNTKRAEKAPDGGVDENVFDIQQGVAISVWSRTKPPAEWQAASRVMRADLWGSREMKYKRLVDAQEPIRWQRLDPVAPFYLLVEQDVDLRTEYDAFLRLPEGFPVNNTGVITKRDDLTIGWTRDDVWKTVSRFVSLTPAKARDEFRLPEDVRDWKVEWAQRDLRTTGLDKSRIKPISYRPFDTRFIFYTGHARGFVGWPVEKVMRHMLPGNNYGLISARSNKSGSMDHFFITRHMMETKCGERTTQSCLFPLFVLDDGMLTSGNSGSTPNIAHGWVRRYEQHLQLRWCPTGARGNRDFSPEDVLFYSYAVFHSPTYRTRYAEFLKIDFPRVPLPGSLQLFRSLSALGGQLAGLHLLESAKVAEPITSFRGPKNPVVGRVGWSDDTVWLDAGAAKDALSSTAGTMGFVGVPSDVWNVHVGGYQVLEKWLKDRKGRTLSTGDVEHYQKIVVALSETIQIMTKVDTVIDDHGGWPAAFVSTTVRGDK
jgi:predicted helicase